MAAESTPPRTADMLDHVGWLRRLALDLTGDRSTADDLVQETWMAALREGPKRGLPLGPWLGRVLRNRAASMHRESRRRTRREEETARPEAVPSSAQLTQRAEATRRLVNAVLSLPETQQQVILLRHFEEMSVRRIAEVTATNEAAIRSRLSRAMEALRHKLDHQSGGNRTQWLQALTPLVIPSGTPLARTATIAQTTSSSGVIAGALLMSTAAKTAAAIAVAALLGLGIHRTMGPSMGADSPTGAPPRSSEPSPKSAPTSPVDAPTSGRRAAEPEPRVAATQAVPARAISGRLIDEDTGDPVPYFALGIGTGEEAKQPNYWEAKPYFGERVMTDADGKFTTKDAFEEGLMHAVLLEDWDSADSRTGLVSHGEPRAALAFEHRFERQPVELSVEVGVSYFLESTAFAGADIRRFGAALGDLDRPASHYSSAIVVRGDRVLARFAPLERGYRIPKDLMLSVVDATDHRIGMAAVQHIKTWPPPTVQLDLVAASTLNLEVKVNSGTAPDTVKATVWSGVDTEAQPIWDAMTSSSFAGILGGQREWQPRMSIQWIPTGTHSLRVSAAGFDDWTRTVDLPQGKTSMTVNLSRNAAADGWISGTVSTTGGQPPTNDWVAYINQTEPGQSGALRWVPITTRRGTGPWVGQFKIDSLIDGDYDVWIQPAPRVARDSALPESSPKRTEAAPGGDVLSFEILDTEATRIVELKVTHSQTGEPIPEFDVMIIKKENGIEFDPRPFSDGNMRAEFPKDPGGAMVWIEAPGLGAEIFTLPEFPGPDGAFRMDIGMAPGWSAPVQVASMVDGKLDSHGGARIFVNGKLALTTDAKGIGVLREGARPETLRIELAGFTLERIHGPIGEDQKLTEASGQSFHDRFLFLMKPK